MRQRIHRLAAVVVCCGVFNIQAQTAPSAVEAAAYTGLHRSAVQEDRTGIARLIESGADVDGRDARGRTPLMVAAYQRDSVVAKLLIEGGADINALDAQRYDMLTISAVLNDIEMLELAIAAGADATLTTSPYDGTALIAAAHLGHVEVVRALIRAGAPPDHVNNLKWTALIEAIVLGDGGIDHQHVVADLIDAGADVNLADGDGNSPLWLARSYGYAAMEKLLLDAGAR